MTHTRNFVPERYRSVSVTTVPGPLTQEALGGWFLGKEAYRRTEFVIVQDGAGRTAVVRVTRGPVADPDPLFSPITGVELLAGPDECAMVADPAVDTGIPTQLARAAAAAAPGARCVVVRGRYEHVNFILDPAPIDIDVVEVVPPHPAKLVDQLERVLELEETLPPVALRPQPLDLLVGTAGAGTGHWLFPCRGSGATVPGATVSYLDERPPRGDWSLVGCARSREIHRWFYGDLPDDLVEGCPRQLAGTVERPTIVKCCLYETGVLREGLLVTVPWGASLDEIREGLRLVLAAAAGAAP